jgi:iron complex outermembrane recepter protein
MTQAAVSRGRYNPGYMLVAAGLALRAAAQPPEADSPMANAPAAVEVVVTARKRQERAADVPDSLVVLDEASLENMQVHEAGDFGKLLPNVGLRQDLSVTSTFLSIRGITATRNTDAAVSLVIDGVQATNASEIRQQLFDVERVEILKGPQGSLYGRNAIAGAINVVTKEPTSQWEGRASVGFGDLAGIGNVGSEDAALSISGPIVQQLLSFRVAAIYYNDDGMIRDPAVDNHTTDFRSDKAFKLRLFCTPGERLNLDFKLSYDGYRGGSYYFAVTRPSGAPFPASNPSSNSNTFSYQPTSVPISVNYSKIIDESLRTTYDIGFATLASVSAHSLVSERYGVPGEGIGGSQPGDLDFTPANIIANPQSYDVDSWSEELRLSSNGAGPLRWMGGLYYLAVSRNDTLPVYLLNGSTSPSAWLILFPRGTHRNVKTYAGFTQLDYDFTSRLTGTLGFRYDHEDRDQFDKDDPGAGTRYATFQLPEPKLSVEYKLDTRQMLYATFSRGFRSGGFNAPRSIFQVVFEPEKLWSYELGYKGSWLAGALRTHAAAFYEDITDKQDFVFDGVNAAQTIYNIPKSRVAGIELETTYQPVSQLVFNVNLGAMDSKIKEFRFGELFPATLSNSQIVGHHVPGFSHWGAQLSADYTTPLGRRLGPALQGFLHLDYSVRGKQYWDVTNTDVEKNVNLFGAAFGVTHDRYTLKFLGTNLLNTRYWSNWFNQQITALPDVGYLAQGRRYGVRFIATF